MDVQGADVLGGLNRFFRENSDNDLVRTLADEWSRGVWEHIGEFEDRSANMSVANIHASAKFHPIRAVADRQDGVGMAVVNETMR